MATKQVKKERGIYEKVPASGIWWIRWTDIEGKLHREWAGTLGNAKRRIIEHRVEKLQGLPSIMRQQPKVEPEKVLLFVELIHCALVYSTANNDSRHTHELKLKFNKMTDLGKLPASKVT